MKYLSQEKRTGSFIYRRRVPKLLQNRIPQGEFVRLLGKSQSEAIINYGPYHAEIEHLINLAKHGVTGISPREQSERLTALLRSWGADPNSSGKNENEQTWREEAAWQLIGNYQDPHSGDFIGVPEEAAITASALLSGVTTETPLVTVTDAFSAYLVEKAKPLPDDRKKQVQRFRRAEKNFLSILGSDKPLEQVTRSDARAWRDAIAASVAPSTVKRYRNDLSAVFSWAITELDGAGQNNPFSKMEIKGDTESRQKQRLPLDQSVIDAVYLELAKKKDLLQIWTLLDYTGARPSEIRELRLGEVVLSGSVPHLVIQTRMDRTLKTGWSERKVPLIGRALQVAKQLTEGRTDNGYCFPKYMKQGGLDNLSQTLNKRVRKYTENPKHVVYSLRHNMADRLGNAEIYERTQFAILGHAPNKGQNASYGSAVPLQKTQAALLKAFEGYQINTID